MPPLSPICIKLGLDFVPHITYTQKVFGRQRKFAENAISQSQNLISSIEDVLTLHHLYKRGNMKEQKNLIKKRNCVVKNHVDLSESFRQNIWKYSELNEMTIVDVANASGIPINTINSFLHHVSNDMKSGNVAKIAKVFGITIDELVGADTLPELTKESLSICRNLPDNDLMLVRWFIRCLADLNGKNEPNKRYVKVMLPEEDNDGNCKLVSKFENMEISDLQEPLRSKIFMGFKVISDYYLPYYKPNDIILIANDRPAKFNEHVLVRVGDFIYIVKRVSENGIGKLYSIRDNKYRIDESEIDESIGYIAYVVRK